MLKPTLNLMLTICAAASLFIFQTAQAQISEFKLTASDGAAGDWFGFSVSISGDYAVVGAWRDDDNGDRSGAAYVFKRSGTSWTQETKLLPSDGAEGDLFGTVSISGDYAVVGASGNDDDGSLSGSAYVYSGFIPPTPPFVANPIMDVVADENFGSTAVALLGDVFGDPNLPNDSLRYTVSISSEIVSGSISGDTLRLFSAADSSGMAEVVVTATDDSSTSVSDTFNVIIVPAEAVPSSFSLAFPSGDTLNTLLPDFSWHTPVDPAFGDQTVYIIRISTFETLLSPLYTETVSDTSYTLPFPLADDSLYFWSVIAFDSSGGFAFSDTSSFLLDKQESPLPFSLISPEHNSVVDSLRPVFSWEPSIDPDPRDVVTYTLIVLSGSADTVYISAGMEESEHQANEDIPMGSYQWFVVAKDADDESLDTQSSEVFSFGVIVGIEDERAGLPAEFALSQNYPNPFNPVTVIKYALPTASDISLVIYNLLGQEVRRWDIQGQTAGFHQVNWNASSLASGVYLYRLQAGDFVQTRKMVLLK